MSSIFCFQKIHFVEDVSVFAAYAAVVAKSATTNVPAKIFVFFIIYNISN